MNTQSHSHFSSTFFKINRQHLRASLESSGLIVIAANGLLQRGGDSAFAFSQDANFWYLTGINDPDITLVMLGESEFLIVPPRDASRTAFDGAIDDSALTSRSGIAEILETEAGWKRLAALLKQTNSVASVAAAPSYIERYGLYANPARQYLVNQLLGHKPKLELQDIGPQLVARRMVKQAPELAALQQAIDITAATITAATADSAMGSYTHEYQLEAAISHGFRWRGASGHAFDPIVAGGKRSCTLHNVANNEQFNVGELVVVDVGAEVEHYTADITRTVAHGSVSARQRSVHEAVVDVQKYAFSLLKPGVLLRDYEKQVEHYMGQTLKALGLISGARHATIRAYFPHATSHFLGLTVHDAGDYSRPLEPGMVITVEPGIYIAEEAIGVRIEDDVVITEAGITVLSAALPSNLAYQLG